MQSRHTYALNLHWEGNLGTGTSGPRDFSRTVSIRAEGKPTLTASADTPFRGDADAWNPEELLLGSLSTCHMLSYFFVAVRHGVVVTSYSDSPTALLEVDSNGAGAITAATLRPTVTIADEAMRQAAVDAHAEASQLCFIANSVRFPVRHEPQVVVE